jgi:hypothetical protein
MLLARLKRLQVKNKKLETMASQKNSNIQKSKQATA